MTAYRSKRAEQAHFSLIQKGANYMRILDIAVSQTGALSLTNAAIKELGRVGEVGATLLNIDVSDVDTGISPVRRTACSSNGPTGRHGRSSRTKLRRTACSPSP